MSGGTGAAKRLAGSPRKRIRVLRNELEAKSSQADPGQTQLEPDIAEGRNHACTSTTPGRKSVTVPVDRPPVTVIEFGPTVRVVCVGVMAVPPTVTEYL